MSAQSEYTNAHRRTRRRLGSATTWPCVVCCGPAEAWALINDGPDVIQMDGMAWSDDPSGYVPMCGPHHRLYDAAYRRMVSASSDGERAAIAQEFGELAVQARVPEPVLSRSEVAGAVAALIVRGKPLTVGLLAARLGVSRGVAREHLDAAMAGATFPVAEVEKPPTPKLRPAPKAHPAVKPPASRVPSVDAVLATVTALRSEGLPVTGLTVGDQFGVSARTGRRYLSYVSALLIGDDSD